MAHAGLRFARAFIVFAILVNLAGGGSAEASPSLLNTSFSAHSGVCFTDWTVCSSICPSHGCSHEVFQACVRNLGNATTGICFNPLKFSAHVNSESVDVSSCSTACAGIHVKQCITGLNSGCKYQVTFAMCGAPSVSDSAGPGFDGSNTAFDEVEIKVGGVTCKRILECCNGVESLCINANPILHPTACQIIRCFDSFSLCFTANAGSDPLQFFELASVSGHVSNGLDDEYTATATVDPHFQVNVSPQAGGAPEIDPSTVAAPVSLVLAILAIMSDRRRR